MHCFFFIALGSPSLNQILLLIFAEAPLRATGGKLQRKENLHIQQPDLAGGVPRKVVTKEGQERKSAYDLYAKERRVAVKQVRLLFIYFKFSP